MVRRVLIIITLGIAALAVAAFFLYPLYAAARWAPELRTAARNADRLVIGTGGPCHPHPDTDQARFETTDTNLIAQVLQQLDAKSEAGMHCRCCGSPTIYFYRKQQMLAALSMHHRATLRWYQGGHSDIEPTAKSMASVLAFFKAQGVSDDDIR